MKYFFEASIRSKNNKVLDLNKELISMDESALTNNKYISNGLVKSNHQI